MFYATLFVALAISTAQAGEPTAWAWIRSMMHPSVADGSYPDQLSKTPELFPLQERNLKEPEETKPEPNTPEQPKTKPEPIIPENPEMTPTPIPPKQPETTPKPTTPKQPKTTPKPTTPKQPETTPNPTTTKQPETTSKPTTPKQPETTPKPTTPKQPETTPKPTTPKQSETTPEPTTTKQPETTPKPTTPKQPETTPKPTTPRPRRPCDLRAIRKSHRRVLSYEREMIRKLTQIGYKLPKCIRRRGRCDRAINQFRIDSQRRGHLEAELWDRVRDCIHF